jgi:hypothetical protein
MENSLSRRKFIKSSIVTTATISSIAILPTCNQNTPNKLKTDDISLFQGVDWDPQDGPAGLLFSQIGYLPEFDIRILIRLPKKELLAEDAACVLTHLEKKIRLETNWLYWGEKWKSHWWIAEFEKGLDEGNWIVEAISSGKFVFRSSGLKVERNVLWNSTIEWASVDMLERRSHFTGVGSGWQDAGTLWVESPAQSAMIISLTELLKKKKESLNIEFEERIHKQIIVGCNYLILTQRTAEELGYAQGSMSHDVLKHQRDILPHDAMKAVVALAKSVQVLPENYIEEKKIFTEAALKAYNWLITEAKPMGSYGYVKIQRGLPEDIEIPHDQWLTRDLIFLCQASLEISKLGENRGEKLAFKYAEQIIARQIPKSKAENKFFGHFFEFDTMEHSEPSWSHGIVPGPNGSEFGADMGGIFPNYLVPIIELLARYPKHEDAIKWNKALLNFVYGYLIPACNENPFFLIPQGIFGNNGPIWFCGTFHGTNSIYGYSAALALELSRLLGEEKLEKIAYNNLQWIAGLNAGITQDSLKLGSVIFSSEIPQGVALPASMICHIGKRWAGTWFQTKGVICNGFSTGEQFKYDTPPLKELDGPFSFTDEDWIPHSASWITGLANL